MPSYVFLCAECGEVARRFPMRAVPPAVDCGCGGQAERVFSAPQVSVSSLYSEANKRGLAEVDATRRADEAIYARNWNRRLQSL